MRVTPVWRQLVLSGYFGVNARRDATITAESGCACRTCGNCFPISHSNLFSSLLRRCQQSRLRSHCFRLCYANFSQRLSSPL